jgi:hypothetical protein
MSLGYAKLCYIRSGYVLFCIVLLLREGHEYHVTSLRLRPYLITLNYIILHPNKPYHIISHHIIIILPYVTSDHFWSYHIVSDHLHPVLSPHVDHIISHHMTSHDITSHHIISHDITSWVNKRIWHFTALHSTVQQSAGECSNIDRYCHYAPSQTPDLTWPNYLSNYPSLGCDTTRACIPFWFECIAVLRCAVWLELRTEHHLT